MPRRPRRVRFTVVVSSPDLERLEAAAAREGLTLREWLLAAAQLACARGSTR